MSAKPRPYESLGRYLLFKKLEDDAVGELWRAARIEGGAVGGFVALRKLSGGNRAALSRAIEHVRPIAPSISGPTFVKNQSVDSAADIPFLVHDYDGGRSLRHVVDKSRAQHAGHPNPIPVEQALAVLEKVALSVETISNLKYGGAKLIHGALLPHFVWITDDGEVRTAGQQLGKGISQSLRVPDFAQAVGGFLAPEIHEGREASRSSDVFSLGALLYLMLTGKEPVSPTNAELFDRSLASAKMLSGEGIPADIREILLKSLSRVESARYASAADLRAALQKLLQSGKYAPTTFNLAFYLSTLLKKELQAEELEIEQERSTSVTPYLEPSPIAPVLPLAAKLERSNSGPIPAPAGKAPSSATPNVEPVKSRKSTLPLVAAIGGVVIAAAAIGGYLVLGKKADAPAKVAVAAAVQNPPVAAPAVPPIVVAAAPADATSTTAAAPPPTVDEAARKKAMEEEINRRLQAEMLKLQADYDRQLQRDDSRSRPPAQQAVAARAAEPEPARATPQTTTQASALPPPPVTTPAPSPVTQTVAQTAPSEQPPLPVAAQIREGDLVEYAEIDRAPELTSPVRPVYPPLAARQKVEGTVILSALVSETGRVLDVRVLRGDSKRMGLDEAAVRALRQANFSPALKDGKRVKTWKPIPIIFKLQ